MPGFLPVLGALLFSCAREGASGPGPARGPEDAGSSVGALGEVTSPGRSRPGAAPDPDSSGGQARRAPSGSGSPSAQEDGSPQVLELPLREGFPLLVWTPRSDQELRVVMSAHGAGGLAEHHCEYWWRQLEGRFLVACLRGHPLYRTEPERGFYYPDHHELGKETAEARRALAAHFGKRLSGDFSYVGYSQGATMGALMVADHMPPFERFVFIEGGIDSWTQARAAQLAERGARRVLLVCGGPRCARSAEAAAARLRAVGVPARSRHAPQAGHTYLGEVAQVVASEVPWVFGP